MIARVTADAWIKSSLIKQKGKSQNGCYEETNPTNFSEKRIFLTP